jgi:hypothetical protein
MAIAYTRVASRPDVGRTVVDVTLDGSYASNGYLLDPKQMGMISIDGIDASFTTGEGFNANYIASTGKLKLFKNAAGAGAFTEGVSGDFTSSMKVRCDVTGTPLL